MWLESHGPSPQCATHLFYRSEAEVLGVQRPKEMVLLAEESGSVKAGRRLGELREGDGMEF